MVTASLDLIAVHPDGEERPLRIRVFAPEESEAGEWSCRATLSGVADDLVPMCGADALQALCLSLSLIERLLRVFKASGGRLLYENGGDEWPLEAYFSATRQ